MEMVRALSLVEIKLNSPVLAPRSRTVLGLIFFRYWETRVFLRAKL